jgi:methionine synthase II (cobalamin-independent)
VTVIVEHTEPESIERFDDATRTVDTLDIDGNVLSTRPYSDEENAAADAAAVAQGEAANDTEIGTKIETVDMPAMQAILDQTNADLRADPSQELKDIAKAVRRLDRKVQKLLDGTE